MGVWLVKPQGTLPLLLMLNIQSSNAKHTITSYRWDAKHVYMATLHRWYTTHFRDTTYPHRGRGTGYGGPKPQNADLYGGVYVDPRHQCPNTPPTLRMTMIPSFYTNLPPLL